MTRQRKQSNRKMTDYLPGHICRGFEAELETLIVTLAASDCPKGKYLEAEYKSKYIGVDTAPKQTRRAAAVAKWLAAEERNAKTNQRIILEEEDKDFGWTTARRLLDKTAGIIRDVLGEFNHFNPDDGSFSNGSSTRIGKAAIAAILKHSGKAHVSSSAVRRWCCNNRGSILEFQGLQFQESSVLFTVPKSTEIDRVACKEPEINMFMQREVGMHIKRRLKRAGIDLSDQTRNQQLAARAYRDGLATVDLSSASDTISTALVHRVLPYEWFSCLDDLRVKSVEVKMELEDEMPPIRHELHMFSSMGNGFTFELESLIFYALTRAICYLSGVKGEVSVYGDDIICSTLIARRLARVFGWLGFSVNPKKSNWSGPLRESCGKHFHKSWEITPFYLRRPIGCKTDVIRILNRLLQWSSEGTGVILDPDIAAFHLKWAKAAVPNVLHGGDDPERDNVLVTGRSPYRGQLVRKTEPLPYPHDMGLIWWLTTARSAPELTCNPSIVTKVTFEPYDRFYHTRVYDWKKDRIVSRKVAKTGWQRPSYDQDIYGVFYPYEPSDPTLKVESEIRGSNESMMSWTDVALAGLRESAMPILI